jgi:hypothetical protein
MLPWSAEAAHCFNFTTSWSPAPLFALWLWTKTVSVSYTVPIPFTPVLPSSRSSDSRPWVFAFRSNANRLISTGTSGTSASLSRAVASTQYGPPCMILSFGGDNLCTRFQAPSPLAIIRALSKREWCSYRQSLHRHQGRSWFLHDFLIFDIPELPQYPPAHVHHLFSAAHTCSFLCCSCTVLVATYTDLSSSCSIVHPIRTKDRRLYILRTNNRAR